jgi:DNA-binding FrmR family transcriptional regulator
MGDRAMTEQAAETKPGTDVETLVARLRRIEGQIRGIQRMLEEDRVCEDIVTQVMAARTALDQVSVLILDHHVQRCIVGGNTPADSMRTMQNALKMWMKLGAPTADAE